MFEVISMQAAMLLLPFAGLLQASTIYSVTDLGAMGGSSTVAFGINSSGIAVGWGEALDRKSTRLNSSHLVISYAVFCLIIILQESLVRHFNSTARQIHRNAVQILGCSKLSIDLTGLQLSITARQTTTIGLLTYPHHDPP